ncbi:chemotaxis protein CheA [Clostridium oryzae]|uniref:Chemotaxis protein CheA n=1 Tax=Clostridium oryzae TaxID=1450648 RepID=A0A1V4IPR8_9CLOT|nr:chemotaxis protein CheA [Clostridium oryzae]
MDLVGEIVIAEAMVRENPDVSNMDLPNFKKATVQLHKIINELQAIVMSIRMVPLANTFYKMNRIVRDMGKKLDKKVELKIYGQDTEVDKNIIEHISDPLMHLIRNSVDHGIESDAERKEKGKNEPAEITLEAKNSSGEVLIIVKDNGRGLNKDKILAKAKENNLWNDLGKEVTAKEIYKFICMPGFSTKDNVSEFSGRGVGMDVVCKNIERIGGTVEIESELGESTTIALKIPLTLAIIDGMNITVGKSKYTIPTTAIKESFKVKKQDIIMDTDGNEMVIVRGKCYPIKRLHAIYNVATSIQNICDGICIMVENQNKGVVVFADELIGERQVVVKALPNYLKNVKGLMGCTLLGDGSISLIIDVENLFG